MNLKYGQFDILERELEKLSPLHLVAFAASCCERLYPHYDIFLRKIRDIGWNEANFMRAALDELWQFLAGKKIDMVKFNQLRSDCRGSYPSDYENEETPEAQRAADAILNTLELCLETTSQQAISVAAEIHETLFEYIDYLMCESDEDWENKSHKQMKEIIANHPFTIREMGKQSSDLQRLKETPTLTREFLHWLRTSSENGGISLLDLK